MPTSRALKGGARSCKGHAERQGHRRAPPQSFSFFALSPWWSLARHSLPPRLPLVPAAPWTLLAAQAPSTLCCALLALHLHHWKQQICEREHRQGTRVEYLHYRGGSSRACCLALKVRFAPPAILLSSLFTLCIKHAHACAAGVLVGHGCGCLLWCWAVLLWRDM